MTSRFAPVHDESPLSFHSPRAELPSKRLLGGLDLLESFASGSRGSSKWHDRFCRFLLCIRTLKASASLSLSLAMINFLFGRDVLPSHVHCHGKEENDIQYPVYIMRPGAYALAHMYCTGSTLSNPLLFENFLAQKEGAFSLASFIWTDSTSR